MATFSATANVVEWTSVDDPSVVFRFVASEASGEGVSDHGALTGLADDDHGLYALADGTRGSFATEAQGSLADTATQPSDLGTSAALDVGTTAGTVAAGDDARLSNARTPTAHATSHQDGGADELALDAAQITSGQLDIARVASGTPDGTKFVRDDGVLATPAGGGGASPTHPRVPSARWRNPPIYSIWYPVASGYVFWVPLPIERSQAFNAIGLIVKTAAAGTVADVALVDDDNGYPGTVQRSSTGLVLTTSIEKLVTGAFSSITPTVGLVWMAVRVDDPAATCQVACVANTTQQWGLLPYTHLSSTLPPYPHAGAHTGYGGGYRSATTLASIPATAPSGMDLPGSGYAPLTGLRAA